MFIYKREKLKRFLLVLCTLFICTVCNAQTIRWHTGNDVYETTTCTSGDTITPPTAPTKMGYTFQGWAKFRRIEYLQCTALGQYNNTGIQSNKYTYVLPADLAFIFTIPAFPLKNFIPSTTAPYTPASAFESLHNIFAMGGLHAHGNHIHIHLIERRTAVTHQRLLLTSENQHIAGLTHMIRIAQDFTASDMGTQLQKSVRAFRHRSVFALVLECHFEFVTGIHRKFVYHRLTEDTVIPIRRPK